MNIVGNFNKLGEVDVSELTTLVNQLTDEDWNHESWRQESYDVHRHTQTISLLFDKDFRHTKPSIHKHYPVFKNAFNEITQVISKAFDSQENTFLNTHYGNGYFIRINVVKLLKGAKIPEHIDENFSLSHSHRIHLPIITNDKVIFTVNGESHNLKQGELYEINNKHTHTVHNQGNQDRVHIIFDWVVPGEQCCCGKKAHPDIPCNPLACKEFDHAAQPCTCLD